MNVLIDTNILLDFITKREPKGLLAMIDRLTFKSSRGSLSS